MAFANESVATLAPRTGTPGPHLPSVNLLSPDTLEHLAVRQVRRRLVAGGLVGVLLVGGGWVAQSMRLAAAEDDLATEQAQTPPLRRQLGALDPVAKFVSALDSRKSAASRAMAAEVLFSGALVDLAKRTPKGVELGSMSVALTPSVVSAIAPPVSPLTKAGIDAKGRNATKTAPPTQTPQQSGTAGGTAAAGVACARPDPFRPASIIGCVTLAGTAPHRDAVGKFIDSMKAGKIYADPFVTTTMVSGADGSKQIQFAGTVGLTGTLVSGRYTDLSWLADPAVLAAAERMIAAGNTAAARLEEQADAAAGRTKAEAEAAERAKTAQEARARKAAEAQAERDRQALVDALKKANENSANDTGEGQ